MQSKKDKSQIRLKFSELYDHSFVKGTRVMTENRIINMGSGSYRETSINDQGMYVENQHNVSSKSNLAEVASEIQALLEQLDQSYSGNNTSTQIEMASQVIQTIEDTPTLTNRVLSALRVGGIDALKQVLNHPAAAFVIAALEDWQKTKDIEKRA